MPEITSTTVRINDHDDTELCVHRWPSPPQPRALVVIYHGFLAHGLYPTVRYAADLLSADGAFAVVSCDLRGHGRSPGLPGYLPGGPDLLIQDATAVAEYARTTLYPHIPKIFLVGSSMGGTIALCVAAELKQTMTTTTTIAGVVLLAPMLRLSVNPLARSLLKGLAAVIPTWQIIPSSSTDAAMQYRDPVKRKECEDDANNNNKSNPHIRVASASTCVELAQRMNAEFFRSAVSSSLLVMVADEDVVVDNQGALDLMAAISSSNDDDDSNDDTNNKTIKHYPALHGLLCEPAPLVNEIQQDMLDWMRARC